MRVHKHFLLVQSKSGGFSLLEVLISIVVLSVGLLGIAGLQLMSLKMNDSAYYRSQAVILAEDMLDRMRSNRVSAISGGYDYAEEDDKKSNGADSGGRAPNTPGKESKTSGEETAADATPVKEDIDQWLKLLKELPGGDGKIEINNNGIVTVTVEWNDSRGELGSGGERKHKNFIVSSQL